MKTFKKSKVVMLPSKTAKLGTIMKCIEEMPNNEDTKINNLAINKNWKVVEDGGNEYWQPQHLYFLSDEEIKQGDWMFHKLDKEPAQWIGEEINPGVYGYKKIIAATDRSLGLSDVGKSGYSVDEFYSVLPQPSQSFIKKFVEEYNKGNVITEVLVEYEKILGDEGVIKIAFNEDDSTLKINPDNTITIQKLKQQFSREEVINLLRLAFDAGKHEAVKMNEWIDETLNY